MENQTGKMDRDRFFEGVERGIADAMLEEDPVKATRQLKDIIRTLERHVERNEDEDAVLALGLAWYHIPLETKSTLAAAQGLFERVLKNDPSNGMARHYLGCLFFDQGSYTEAYRIFSGLRSEYFESMGQIWRWIKTCELRICCCLFEGWYAKAEESWLEFQSQVQLAELEDIAMPSELVKCLQQILLVQPVREPLWLAKIGEWTIKTTANQDVFAEELSLFRSILGMGAS